MKIDAATRDNNPIGSTGLLSAEIDTMKGIYILLIVIGHNTLLSQLFPEFRHQIYNFHVAGFLLFPFLFRSGQISNRFIADRAVRYLVPFAAFYTLCALLYAALISSPTSFVAWSSSYLGGLLLGSAKTVKIGSGFALFWFLPALFTLTLLRATAEIGRSVHIAVVIVCLTLHLVVGAAPAWVKHFMPMGILIAGYMYPMGAILNAAWPRLIAPNINRAGIAGIAVLAPCVYLSIKMKTGINIGNMSLYTAGNIVDMLLHDIYILSAFVTIAWGSTLLTGARLLSILGKYSLVIYLVHSLIYQFLLLVSRESGVDISGLPISIAILLVTLFLALATAFFITKLNPLRVWITPRDAAKWPPLGRGSDR